MKKSEFRKGAIGFLISGKILYSNSFGEKCTLVRLSENSAQHVFVLGAKRGLQEVSLNRVELLE